MTFEEHVAAINTLAEKAGATDPGVPYCDAETWRDGFNEGLTPEDAWSSEVDAFAYSL